MAWLTKMPETVVKSLHAGRLVLGGQSQYVYEIEAMISRQKKDQRKHRQLNATTTTQDSHDSGQKPHDLEDEAILKAVYRSWIKRYPVGAPGMHYMDEEDVKKLLTEVQSSGL